VSVLACVGLAHGSPSATSASRSGAADLVNDAPNEASLALLNKHTAAAEKVAAEKEAVAAKAKAKKKAMAEKPDKEALKAFWAKALAKAKAKAKKKAMAEKPDCASSQDVVGEAMGWLGFVAALVLFTTPIFTFRQIVQSGTVAEYSCTPYLCSLLNCALWSTYALPFVTPCKTQPLVTNGIGSVLEVAYIFLFLYYAPSAKRRSVALQLLGCALLIAGIAGFALVAAPHLDIPSIPASQHLKPPTTVLGIASTLFNIGMYAAPLSVMALVVRTRSVKYMPLSLTLAVGFSSLCWLTYALHVSDDFILIPNALGLLLCAAQVLLYACYCRGEQVKDDMSLLVHEPAGTSTNP